MWIKTIQYGDMLPLNVASNCPFENIAYFLLGLATSGGLLFLVNGAIRDSWDD